MCLCIYKYIYIFTYIHKHIHRIQTHPRTSRRRPPSIYWRTHRYMFIPTYIHTYVYAHIHSSLQGPDPDKNRKTFAEVSAKYLQDIKHAHNIDTTKPFESRAWKEESWAGRKKVDIHMIFNTNVILTYRFIFPCIWYTYTHKWVYMYKYTHISMYFSIYHTHKYVCIIHVCISLCLSLCLYIYLCIYTCMCTYIYIYICIYIYVYTYIYIYIYVCMYIYTCTRAADLRTQIE